MPIVIQQYAPVLKTIAAIMKLMHDEKKTDLAHNRATTTDSFSSLLSNQCE